MTYRVEVAPAAIRQLRKLDRLAHRRVRAAIELLAAEPRPNGAKRLVGGDGEWRVRTGDYRIVYEIPDDVLLVRSCGVKTSTERSAARRGVADVGVFRLPQCWPD